MPIILRELLDSKVARVRIQFDLVGWSISNNSAKRKAFRGRRLKQIEDWLVHFQKRFFRHVYATYQFELLADEFIDRDVDLGDYLDGCFVSVQKLLGHVNGSNSIYTFTNLI